MKYLDQSEVIKRLRELVKVKGSQKLTAAYIGVSPTFLSDVLARKRAPSGLILLAIHVQRVVAYEVIE